MREIYFYIWLFIIYSVMGFVAEVGYCGIKDGRLINRGFLNGPWCPIYGTGALFIIHFLSPLKDNIILLFFASFVITSLIEFMTGFALEKIYKCRWWDYSDKPFNIKGYICLKFSLIWAFVGVVTTKFINTFILAVVGFVPFIIGTAVLVAVILVFITDVVITLMSVNRLTTHLKELEKISADIRRVSDDMSEAVYKNAIVLNSKRIEYEGRIAELKENYGMKLKERHSSHIRLLKAFPMLKMKLKEHQNQLEKLREQYAKNR